MMGQKVSGLLLMDRKLLVGGGGVIRAPPGRAATAGHTASQRRRPSPLGTSGTLPVAASLSFRQTSAGHTGRVCPAELRPRWGCPHT